LRWGGEGAAGACGGEAADRHRGCGGEARGDAVRKRGSGEAGGDVPLEGAVGGNRCEPRTTGGEVGVVRQDTQGGGGKEGRGHWWGREGVVAGRRGDAGGAAAAAARDREERFGARWDPWGKGGVGDRWMMMSSADVAC
jgi:hypothetical protein